jgi:tetratricopeptide (TPR) repeat protein
VAGHLQIAGRYREEVELVAAAVERRPDYTSLCMLGVALARGGSPHKGIEVLNRAVRLNPDSFLAFHDLAEIYEAIGRPQDAIAAYEAELVRRPRSLETRRRIQALRDSSRTR